MKYAILLTLLAPIGSSLEINEPVTSKSVNLTDNVSLEIEINASTTIVWDIITNPEYAKELGGVFTENAFQDSDWQLGSEVHFKIEPKTIHTL